MTQPSEAQRRARARNWRILQLRNLYGTIASYSTGAPQELIREVQGWVDKELGRINAEPESIRRNANRAELLTPRGISRHAYIAAGLMTGRDE